MAKELKVTTISELKTYAEGSVVELPPFAEGMPFVARLRRPSLMVLIKNGKIPNELLKEANDLFMGRKDTKSKGNDENEIKDMLDILRAICEASFIEPTWEDIQKSGIELTDDQYTFVFNYSQRGVKALKSFRNKSQSVGPDSTK